MQTFRKHERLCNYKVIRQLFTSGKSFRYPPFVAIWQEVPFKTGIPLQVLFTTGNREKPTAVERNHNRRLMREAWRKNKYPFREFLSARNRACALIILFNGKEKLKLQEAEAKIILILQRLQSIYEKTAG